MYLCSQKSQYWGNKILFLADEILICIIRFNWCAVWMILGLLQGEPCVQINQIKCSCDKNKLRNGVPLCLVWKLIQIYVPLNCTKGKLTLLLSDRSVFGYLISPTVLMSFHICQMNPTIKKKQKQVRTEQSIVKVL